MKRTSRTIVLACCLATAFSLILPACTHNNGDIGVWFGTWHVNAITHAASGEPVATYRGAHFMQFQNNVIRVSANDSLHNYEQSFGTWEADDINNLLHINFPDDDQFQCTMPGIARANTFVIKQKSDSHITLLQADAPDDDALQYSLTKLN